MAPERSQTRLRSTWRASAPTRNAAFSRHSKASSSDDLPVASSSKHSDSPPDTKAQRRTRPDPPKPYEHKRDVRPPPLNLSDLECVCRIGTGGNGQVLLVRVTYDVKYGRKQKTSTLPLQLAMKVTGKRSYRYRERNLNFKKTTEYNQYLLQERSVERRWLTELPWNPFICGLIDTFDDKVNFYHLLELSPCLSFHSYLKKSGVLSTEDARFYFSNIVLALEFLHSHDIVHRDIKPGNMLMGADGYLCLADFGSAAHISHPHDWTRAGTTVYTAPEINLAVYTAPEAFPFVDWWAAAVSLFEMVTGNLPFAGNEDHELLDPILNHDISWPEDIDVDPDLKDLVTRMLIPVPFERYGGLVVKDDPSTVGKNDEVRIHPFMHGKVKWKRIQDRRDLAPYVPHPCPDLSEGFYTAGVPNQREIPGLPVASTSVEQQWDDRFERLCYDGPPNVATE